MIEFSIVLFFSGLITTGAIHAYSVYRWGEAPRVSYSKLKTVDRNLEAFFESQGRYPCPAAPKLLAGDPNAGVENCAIIAALGACDAGTGICRAGGRATPFGDPPPPALPTADPVLIGAIPYKTIQDALCPPSSSRCGVSGENGGIKDGISRAVTLDFWNRQMTYAVTEQLTVVPPPASHFPPSPGAIDVRTDTLYSLTEDLAYNLNPLYPGGNVFWVVLSHGADGVGAYRDNGVMAVACPPAPYNSGNWNCLTRTAPAFMSFLNGITTLVPGPNYFDDFLYFSKNKIKGLWTVAATADDITNRNTGKVGIGTRNPIEQLDVSGNIKALESRSSQVCDGTGTKCFNPAELGGDPLFGGGMVCPPAAGLLVSALTGIANSDPVCATVTRSSVVTAAQCPPGNPVVGVTAAGCLVCLSGITPGCP